jgi:hypothetical protein
MPAFALKYASATGDITGQGLYNGNISNSTLAFSINTKSVNFFQDDTAKNQVIQTVSK